MESTKKGLPLGAGSGSSANDSVRGADSGGDADRICLAPESVAPMAGLRGFSVLLLALAFPAREHALVV